MPVITDKKKREALLPVRHPNPDFFVCDITDAVPKDDMGSMEHPMFTLSTKPDLREIHYDSTNGVKVDVTPSIKGLATIHDKDVLIYCISQLIAKKNSGEETSKTVNLHAYDLLVATNRQISGQGYALLTAALERLSGTRIKTSIRTNGEEQISGFGIIDKWDIIKKRSDGRMISMSVTLSDWLYNAVLGNEVLTLNRDYFRLRKPIERRLYEIGRKHCGRQKEWSISIVGLLEKSGSSGTLNKFRAKIKVICKDAENENHMPDYTLRFDEEADKLIFINQETMGQMARAASINDVPPLKAGTYEQARDEAPGWDVYHIEREWREWLTEAPRNAEAAFLGFCRKWYEKRGAAR